MTNQISVQDLPSIHHNSIPVITTELLAKLYDAEINSIQQNFKRNSERFVAGKHYFKISGEDLRNLRLTMSQLQISPKTRSLILWTERGAARHAKMLETDQAWDVFEALEDFYFNQKDVAPATASVKTNSDDRTPLRKAVSFLVGRKKMIYKEAYELVHHRFNVNHIDELPIEKLPAAVEYVHKLALEGEYLGKEELPALEIKQQISDDDLQTLCWLWQHSINMARYMIDIEPLLRVAEHKLAATYYEYPRNSIRCANNARRILEKATEHIQIKQIQLDNWRVLHSLRIPNSPF
ncbi:ORF6N domain-containing protein [Photorhabdus luminescens]|uniref:ORF6N domain-containing protein n=1 Tax=Photorhabdus luminescens TaxID=29488 RepID=UPI001864F6E7